MTKENILRGLRINKCSQIEKFFSKQTSGILFWFGQNIEEFSTCHFFCLLQTQLVRGVLQENMVLF